MVNKPGRNDPCPCGSGKKFKKCCLAQETAGPAGYTAEERNEALIKIDRFVQRGRMSAEGHISFRELCGRFADRLDELHDHARTTGRHIHDLWFAFDRPMDDGSLAVDRFQDRHGPELSAGERPWPHDRPYHDRVGGPPTGSRSSRQRARPVTPVLERLPVRNGR